MGIRTYSVIEWNLIGRKYTVMIDDDIAIMLKLKYS
jgi:hypothetical protein